MTDRQAYPPDLADFAVQQWPSTVALDVTRDQLESALSSCFLSSLTTEEGRPVRFRLLLARPDTLPENGAPNAGVLRLRFEESRPFTPDELRRLSPSVPFETSLIGVHVEHDELRIWGIAHSGATWLAPSWGGRRSSTNWTHAPIIHVTGPGRLAVRSAGRLVAGLERGTLISSSMDVFESSWLPDLFADAREALKRDTNDIEHSLIQTVSQHLVRRMVRLIRSAGHGGMILIAETDECERYRAGGGAVHPKYSFAADEPRARYRTLLRRLMATLGAIKTGSLGWEDFRDADTPELTEIEQSIFELSRLVASLAATDGAVLLDKRFDLFGFGAEVSAEIPAPQSVWRAIDLEGERRECDLAESVGTRHRAAYRFVQNHPRGLAIVVSYDGAVRFVAHRPEGVTYWEQSVSP